MVAEDERIRQAVLQAASDLGETMVSCSVEEGLVTLEGMVSSDETASQLEAAASSMPGVRHVVNDLMVEGFAATVGNVVEGVDLTPDFTAQVGTDDFLTAVSEAEPYMPPTDPVVRPNYGPGGVEILGGFAESADQGTPISGPSARPPGDEELRDAVLTALRLDAATSDLPVEVEVEEGVVHLRGTVLGLEDADLVESVAARVPGVAEVSEELEVAGM